MNKCISRHGEYSEHTFEGHGEFDEHTFEGRVGEFTCRRCLEFDEDAALAELALLRRRIDEALRFMAEALAYSVRFQAPGSAPRWPTSRP